MRIRPIIKRTTNDYTHRSSSQIAKQLQRTIWILAALVAAHVAAMMAIEGLSLWQSIWLTFTTLTTVGYGDLSAKTPWGQMATITLMYIAAITLVTFLIRDYVDYRISKHEQIRAGNWNWKMNEHILIINAPKYNGEQFFQRLVSQIRMDDDYKETPILLLNTEFSQGLPAQLKELGVKHVTGSGNNEADLKNAQATDAKHIFVLARDEYHADSDSITFDIADRLSRHQLAQFTLVECVDDSNRERIEELGIKSILRPIRSYPEMLVRAMDAPGSEVVIEDMFTRSNDHPERYSIWLEGERWADVVNAMIQAGVGTPMAYINKEGEITVHPKGDDHVVAQSLIVLVKSEHVPSQQDVDTAFQHYFQKSLA